MDPAEALAALQQAPLDELSILKLAAPYLKTQKSSVGSGTTQQQDQQPISDLKQLSAELALSREEFSKLRFQYVEQVTKERFLRAIMSEQLPPTDARENAELEGHLAKEKAALKTRKAEVQELISDLEKQGRMLAQRYNIAQEQTQQLQRLPQEIAELEATVQELRRAQPEGFENNGPEYKLSLADTLEVVQEREDQLSEINRQIEALQNAVAAKEAKAARLEESVAQLREESDQALSEADDALRRDNKCNGLDKEYELRLRWLRAVDAGMRKMLEV